MADSLIIFKEGTKAKASEVNENFNYIMQEMSTQISNVRTYLEGEFKKISGNFVLPGTIIHIAYGAVPTGYLKCDGTTYLRTEYPELFKVIGTIYGTTDSTNFKVPDFQGQFLRGFGGKSSSLGVAQEGGLPNITGDFNGAELHDGRYISANGAFQSGGSGWADTPSVGGDSSQYGFNFDASRCSELYGKSPDEVRPDNYAVMLCIKY